MGVYVGVPGVLVDVTKDVDDCEGVFDPIEGDDRVVLLCVDNILTV